MAQIRKASVIITATMMILSGCENDGLTDPLDRIYRIEAVNPEERSGVVGTVVAPQPVVRVTDRNGKPVSSAPVAFAITAGNGAISAAAATTDANGTATVTWTLGTVPQMNSLTVLAGTLDPVVFNARSIAGPPGSIERIDGDHQLAVIGSVLGTPLKMRVLDSYRNAVGGASVSFTVATGAGTINKASAITDSTGTVTAIWTVGSTPGSQTVRVQAGTATTVFSAYTYTCPATEIVSCSPFGELVFVKNSDRQLYRTNGKETVIKLTSEGNNFRPIWSPNGQRIAFLRNQSGQFGGDVYVMDADGSNLVRRTSKGIYLSATWSPDGSKLAISGYLPGYDYSNLYIISAEDDNSAETLLTSDGAYPEWSPDGKTILYMRGTGYYDVGQIYLINADGTGARPIPGQPLSYSWSPTWARDGKKIAFITCQNVCQAFVMNVDGSNARRITPAMTVQRIAWSPDGEWLVVSTYGNPAVINYLSIEGGTQIPALFDALDGSLRHRTP